MVQIRWAATAHERIVDPPVELSSSAFKILKARGHPSVLKLAVKIIASVQRQTKQGSVSLPLLLFFF